MQFASHFRRFSAFLVCAAIAALASLPALAAERVSVGQSAPAFSLAPAGGGAAVELASLKGSKRALVVFFRGSW